MRDTNGIERVSRGCIDKVDHIPLYCSTQAFDGTHHKRQTGGQYAIECCVGDLCNNGTFPALPPVTFKGKS